MQVAQEDDGRTSEHRGGVDKPTPGVKNDALVAGFDKVTRRAAAEDREFTAKDRSRASCAEHGDADAFSRAHLSSSSA